MSSNSPIGKIVSVAYRFVIFVDFWKLISLNFFIFLPLSYDLKSYYSILYSCHLWLGEKESKKKNWVTTEGV